MEQIGTIETACRYPVKSMAGEERDAVFVGFSGVMGDRMFAFAQTGGTEGFPWHTGRVHENMILYRPQYHQDAETAMPLDVAASLAMAPGAYTMFPHPSAFDLSVTTPDGRTLAVQDAQLSAELAERGGKPVSLRFSERSICDCRPVSLFGNASARALGQELGRTIDRRRFRANFYVDWADDQPFREDTLVGRTLQIGDRLRIAVLERDPRCKMITLDPDTAERDPTVLRQVAQAHDGKAGVYAAVLLEGVVRKGDPILLI